MKRLHPNQKRFYVIAIALLVTMFCTGTVAYACGWGDRPRPQRPSAEPWRPPVPTTPAPVPTWVPSWTAPPTTITPPPVPQWTPSWTQPTWRPTVPKPPTKQPTWKPPTTTKPPTSSKPPTTASPKPSTTSPTPTPSQTSTGDLTPAEAEVLRLVNVERAKVAGCPALTADKAYMKLARDHSKNMAAQQLMSHTLDGVTAQQRAQRAGLTNWNGENIAYGYSTPQSVMSGWMNSSGHKANILNCSSKVFGVGVAYSSGNTPYWTQEFGR